MTDQHKTQWTVDDVVRRFGITPRTLHYYEEVELITPVSRTSGGHRLYDDETVERLDQILRLKENLGSSLAQIRQVLEVEQSLQHLRAVYQVSERSPVGANPTKPVASATALADLDNYILLLKDLVNQMDNKLERLSQMREIYRDRLDKAIRFRTEQNPTENGV